MGYKDLLTYCQSQDIHVSRKLIRDKIEGITGKKITFTVSGNLNPKDVRGMFVSVESNSSWVKRNSCDVVVLSRAIFSKAPGGNYCWERFIIVKEMMHVFDGVHECSDTGEKFDEILSAFLHTYDGKSDVVASEIKAFWRALGVLCPEKYRKEFGAKVLDGSMTYYDVALKFRIPEQYIPSLLNEKYAGLLANVSN